MEQISNKETATLEDNGKKVTIEVAEEYDCPKSLSSDNIIAFDDHLRIL